jgi:dephospho-CoA kinase
MPKLLGVTGYSGAGKTSAIEYIAGKSGANRIYVGQLVADEVIERRLPPGADSERAVRVSLRQLHGVAGLAILVAPAIRANFSVGRSVLIDAICSLEEMEYYRKTFDATAVLVSILASFDVRADRVAVRSEKAMTRDELLQRDELENMILRTDIAIEAAEIAICNEGDFSKFHNQLDERVCDLLTPDQRCP